MLCALVIILCVLRICYTVLSILSIKFIILYYLTFERGFHVSVVDSFVPRCEQNQQNLLSVVKTKKKELDVDLRRTETPSHGLINSF